MIKNFLLVALVGFFIVSIPAISFSAGMVSQNPECTSNAGFFMRMKCLFNLSIDAVGDLFAGGDDTQPFGDEEDFELIPVDQLGVLKSGESMNLRKNLLGFDVLPRGEPDNFKGYIVEYKKKPVIEYQLEQQRANPSFSVKSSASVSAIASLSAKVKAYSQIIEAEQDRTAADLALRLKISQEDFEKKVLGEFKNSFNGIALDITENEVQEIKQSPQVKNVYPNYEVKIALADSVPLIGADRVWKLDKDASECVKSGKVCLTGKGVKIGIIDTGVDYTHPDLGGCTKERFQNRQCTKVAGGYDFVNDDSDPMDDQGHGTHVAATAAGNGALKGAAPDASIYAYKVLSSNGQGYSSWIISGIERAADPDGDGDFSDRLDVINLSLGGPGNPDDPMSRAIDRIVDAGVVVIIAAGNSGPSSESIGSPGTARKAITVAASDKSGQIAGFSSRGPVVWPGGGYLEKPDITAPGVSICAAEWDDWLSNRRCLDNTHIAISGTSMAAPHVSGVAALLKQMNKDFSPSLIKFFLKQTAKDLDQSFMSQGSGLVNALKAAELAQSIIASPKPEFTFNNDAVAYLKPLNKIEFKIIIDSIGLRSGENVRYRIFDADNKESPLFEDIIPVLPAGGSAVISRVFSVPYFPTTLVFDLNYNRGIVEHSYENNRLEIKPAIPFYSGWPKDLNKEQKFSWDAESIFAVPAIADLDGDGLEEIVISVTGSKLGRVDVFRADGSRLARWPKTTSAPLAGSPLAADVDSGYPGLEIIQALSNGYVHAWHADGTPVTGWPQTINQPKEFSIASSPALADLDQDGKPEIVLTAEDEKVYAWHADGAPVTGWPQDAGQPLAASPSIGDVDSQYTGLEVVAITKGGNVYVWHADGTLVPGWPKPLKVPSNNLAQDPSSPAIADLDGDGKLEIISAFNGVLGVWNANGTFKPGWPQEIINSWSMGFAIADLDGNGQLEIVGRWGEAIGIWYHDGRKVPGWPKFLETLNLTPPAVADLDGDGIPEILSGSFDKNFYAWHADGTLVPGWPQRTDMFGIWTSVPAGASVADLNGDGYLEVIVGTADAGFYVWTSPQLSKEKKPWPEFMHDSENTGRYGYQSSSSVPAVTLLSPNGGERWMLNSGKTIVKWKPDPPDYPVVKAYLEKLEKGGNYVTLGEMLPSAKGSIQWSGELNRYGNYAEPGERYFVRVENTKTGNFDRSDAPFTILSTDYMKVDLKVNGADGPFQLPEGTDSLKISWTSENAESCNFYGQEIGSDIEKLPPSGERTVAVQNTLGTKFVSLTCESDLGVRNDFVKLIFLKPLDTPQNLQAFLLPRATSSASTTPSIVGLRWDDISTKEDGFEIWRSNTPGGEKFYAAVGADKTDFIDDEFLKPDTVYYYRVAAYQISDECLVKFLKFRCKPQKILSAFSNEAVVSAATSFGKIVPGGELRILREGFVSASVRLEGGGVAPKLMPKKITPAEIIFEVPGSAPTDYTIEVFERKKGVLERKILEP